MATQTEVAHQVQQLEAAAKQLVEHPMEMPTEVRMAMQTETRMAIAVVDKQQVKQLVA
jgi:hypothetical protein